jgi:hypothetical protein
MEKRPSWPKGWGGFVLALWGFDFCASQTYTMDVLSQCSTETLRLWKDQGSDQDGGAPWWP